jgi:Methylamine utilisation protein MauE
MASYRAGNQTEDQLRSGPSGVQCTVMDAPAVATSIGGFCAGVFLYAAVGKATVLNEFEHSLSWLITSDWIAGLVARLIVAAEAIVGLGLLIEPTRAPAAIAGALLMVTFTATLLYARGRRLEASCMCFGGQAEPISPQTIARDAALTLLLFGLSVFGSAGSPYLEIAGAGFLLAVLLLASMKSSVGWMMESLR